MAKTTALSFIGTASENYIQQITAIEGTFDIAPYHKIVFYDGAAAVSGVEWDGTQDLEVVIPTIADLVKDPVKFAGTVDASDGTISWTTTGHSAQKGDLVYMTVDCTFNTIACEAGDMAIFDGTNWHVVTGENQVTINAAAAAVSGNDNLFSITGAAKTLLSVEGKTLSVAIDYADVRSKIAVSLNDELSRNLTNGSVTLNSTKLAVSEVAGTPSDITTSVSFDLPYALADGTVTVGQSVLTSGDFTFNSGSFPTIVKNEAVEATVSHNLSIGKSSVEDSTTGDYVTTVDAIKAVSFTAASDGEHDFAYVANVSTSGTKSFVSGLHTFVDGVDDSTKADFTVYGAVTAASANNTFATGWDTEASTGEVVSSITVGNVTIGASSAGNALVTGLSGEGSTVITGVTFGTISFGAGSDFVTGLGSTEASTGDVVTSVDFGTVSLSEDASVTAKASAIVSATVSNHVLSFTTANFMKPVAVQVTGQSVLKKEFTKGSATLTGFSSASDTLVFGGISQAETTISYKSLTSSSVTLTQDATLYYLDKASQDQYVAEMSYVDWSLTAATVSKNTPVLENTGNMKATIPANTFAVSLSTDGVLPSLTVGTPTGALTASVGTALSTSEFSFLGVASDKKNITIPSYTLVSGAESGIDVALAGDYTVTGTITIPSNQYVKDVLVDGTSVIPAVVPEP
jgi:hypothetical protein